MSDLTKPKTTQTIDQNGDKVVSRIPRFDRNSPESRDEVLESVVNSLLITHSGHMSSAVANAILKCFNDIYNPRAQIPQLRREQINQLSS